MSPPRGNGWLRDDATAVGWREREKEADQDKKTTLVWNLRMSEGCRRHKKKSGIHTVDREPKK